MAVLKSEMERTRHGLLMQVLTGFALDTTTDNPSVEDDIPSGVVQAVLNKFGPAVAGYWSGLGETVTQILHAMAGASEDPCAAKATRSSYSSNQVSVVLLLALRTSYRELTPWTAKPSLDQDQQQHQLPALRLSLQFGDKSRAPR